MFQNFNVKSNPANGPKRLAALRQVMREKNVTAFLVPHADEHQNEYLPERAERLAWLTGFTGSAGFCIVTFEQAVVFTDGRYTLQLREQTDGTAFAFEDLIETPPAKWLKQNIGDTDIVAYDPWLTTLNQVKQYTQAIAATKAKLQPSDNLIDAVWEDQPHAPEGSVSCHSIEYSGKAASDKLAQVQEIIQDLDCDFCLLTDPASLAWMFNIRGSDMVHNPLALGFAIVPASTTPELFMQSAKLSAGVRSELSEITTLHEPDELIASIEKHSNGKKVLCDPALVASVLGQAIKDAGGTIIEGRDPVVLPRAIKNETELDGARAAHIRDGVAMAKFLCWLDQQTPATLDEITVASKLETIRAENAQAMGSELLEISFDTISGFGSNGAIVHYRVNTDSNKTFENNNLYLCDSGAQYRDGTTDITRTIAIGTPPAQSIDDFTRVLKGHIKIALARFPSGTRGVDIDVLARSSLWEVGKDFGHGTGHGIGSYMNVHEGPQGISKRAMEPFKAGMIVSNEPGFYIQGEYGIRIENLVIVEEAKDVGGNIQTHGFETITLTPIDHRLIDKSLLEEREINWLNAYHKDVFEKLSPHLNGDELAWLKQATLPI